MAKWQKLARTGHLKSSNSEWRWEKSRRNAFRQWFQSYYIIHTRSFYAHNIIYKVLEKLIANLAGTDLFRKRQYSSSLFEAFVEPNLYCGAIAMRGGGWIRGFVAKANRGSQAVHEPQRFRRLTPKPLGKTPNYFQTISSKRLDKLHLVPWDWNWFHIP